MKSILSILLTIAFPSFAVAQTRGSVTTIDTDGSVVVSAPAIRPAIVRTTSVRYGYPVRGNHWSYPGNSRGSLIRHLQSGQHAGKFSSGWLNTLSYQQLLSAHDDDHEGRLKTQYIRMAQVQSKQEAKAEEKKAKAIGKIIFGTSDGRHPGPVGGWIRGLFGDVRYRSGSGCPGGVCPR